MLKHDFRQMLIGVFAFFYVVITVTLPVCSGFGIVCWQIYNWLESGKWMPVQFMDVFFLSESPQTNWLGVNKIINYLLSCPASVALIGISAIWYFVVVGIIFVIENDK